MDTYILYIYYIYIYIYIYIERERDTWPPRRSGAAPAPLRRRTRAPAQREPGVGSVCVHMYMYIYIYIYRERERERSLVYCINIIVSYRIVSCRVVSYSIWYVMSEPHRWPFACTGRSASVLRLRFASQDIVLAPHLDPSIA